jgi:excisionase family DNA binding protein
MPEVSLFSAVSNSTNQPSVPKLLYTRKEVAYSLGLSLRSVCTLLKNGQLKYRRIGAKVLIPQENLIRFAKAHPATVIPGALDSDGEGTGEVDLIDKHAASEWKIAQREPHAPDETEAEYLQRCLALLPTLRPELRDVAGLWLEMLTEQQIAEQLGISPQKVGRLKVKIKAAITDAVVAK